MSGKNNEPLNEILIQYPYNVNEIRLHRYKEDRAVWWIHTNKGLKVLKKFPRSENRLKFILEAMTYLRSKGIHIPKIHKTINNELYVNIDGTCYILMKAIDGNSAIYTDEKGFKTVITEMGNFHRASSGFTPSDECDVSNWLGECSKKYTKEYNNLKTYYMKKKQEALHTVFEETAIREMPYFLKRIEDIQTDLSNSKHAIWVDKISESGGLCHMDFSLHNIIITPSKKPYILDFDDLSMGLPLWDIRILFFSIMNCIKPFKKQNLESMINWYQNANPLTADEWHVVKLNLLFPYKFVDTIKDYTDKSKNWSEDKYLLELKKAIESEKLMLNNLKGFDHIIERLFLVSKQ